MGYSEQTNWFPQLSLSGIPSTEEQIWNGLTVGSPWQGASLQQAEMEHNDAETSDETIPYIPSRSELLGTNDYYAAQDETQVSTPLIQSHEYNTYGYRDGRTWVWWDENGNRHSRPIPEYITADTRTDWQRERDQKKFERRAAAEQEAKNKEEAAVAARALFGLALPSTYIGPLFNNNGESYLYNVVTQQGSGNEAGDFVIDLGTPFGYGALAKGGRYALNLGTNAFTKGIGRTSWRPALRLETQPLRISTQPLTTESQVFSFNPYPQYIKRSGELGVAPSNLSQATAEFESLLDPTTYTIHTEQLLDKYPTFRDWFYGLTEADQKMVLRTPVTTPVYFADAIQDFMGTKLSLADKILIKTKLKPTSAFYNLDFMMAPLPDTPVKFGSKVLSGKGYTISKPGIITISPSQLVGTMPNADTPIDIGQMLVHEFSHAITLNNPMHQQFLKFTPEINAHLMGFNFDQFKNSQAVMDEVNWKAQLLLSQGKKVDYQALIEEEATKLWNYMFKLGETEQLARLSQLKAFTKYKSPYYLKSYTNWNDSKFKTVDDLKRAFQLYLAENFDNNMSTYYNMLELGGNRAWEQALHQINHWAPVIIPGIMGADAILSHSDDESSSDINDEL